MNLEICKKPEEKFQLRCSCVVCKKAITSQNLKSHYRAHHIEKKVKSYCLQCNEPIFNSNKFCCRSCAGKYNNARKDWSKIKTGPSKFFGPSKELFTKNNKKQNRVKKELRLKSKSGSWLRPKYTKISQCVICNKYHPKQRATCSPSCLKIHRSNKQQLRIQNGWNPNINRGRYKKSYLEKSFEDWLRTNFPDIEFITEFKFKRIDPIKTYFADFYFPKLKLIVELDGSQHLKTKVADEERDSYISKKYGLEIIRVSHIEYKEKSKLPLIVSKLSKENQI